MSPIYVRPAREQSEHDRLIRHLQSKYKKKFDVAINIDGVEPQTAVKIGPATLFPDLVLTADKKLAGLVEVETGESINNLEVMAQWVHFASARVPFHLYVPVHGYEAARRLCDTYRARASEIWTYRPLMDGFDLVRMHADAGAAAAGRVSAKVSVVAPPPPPKPEPKAVPAPPPPAKPASAGKAVPVVKPTAPPSKPVKQEKAKPVKAAAKPKAAKATKVAKAKPAKPTKAAAKPAAKARKPPAAKARKGPARKSR